MPATYVSEMTKRFNSESLRPAPTIRDVAAHADVSPAVVSFVLNGSRPVSPEYRMRVERAIRALGYAPNANARSLRSKKTGLIGIVVPYLNNPFFALLAGSAEQELGAHGYLAIICSTGAEPRRRRAYFDALLAARVDGLLVYPTHAVIEHLIRGAERDLPIVLVEREIELPPGAPAFDAVIIDNELGTFTATEHLLDLGHRQIGLLTLEQSSPSGPPRIAGYRRAYREHGLTPDPSWIGAGAGTSEAGHALTQALLSRPERPTALVITTNMQMLGAFEAIRQLGLAIPDDLSVVGFGPSLMPMASLEATLVTYPAGEVGRSAAAHLVDRIGGGLARINRRVILQPQLQLGRSTRPLTGETTSQPDPG